MALSHGLFMAVIWSLLGGGIALIFSRKARTALIIGLLVFSHWVVDFISHPMRAAFSADVGLPVLFGGSPRVGLGAWSSPIGMYIGEIGTSLLGIAIYILTLIHLRKNRRLLLL